MNKLVQVREVLQRRVKQENGVQNSDGGECYLIQIRSYLSRDLKEVGE